MKNNILPPQNFEALKARAKTLGFKLTKEGHGCGFVIDGFRFFSSLDNVGLFLCGAEAGQEHIKDKLLDYMKDIK